LVSVSIFLYNLGAPVAEKKADIKSPNAGVSVLQEESKTLWENKESIKLPGSPVAQAVISPKENPSFEGKVHLEV